MTWEGGMCCSPGRIGNFGDLQEPRRDKQVSATVSETSKPRRAFTKESGGVGEFDAHRGLAQGSIED